MTEHPEIITASVKTFSEISGLSRMTIYRLIHSGALRSVKLGTRRLIVIESYRKYLAELVAIADLLSAHKSIHKRERAAGVRQDMAGYNKAKIPLVRND
jgi:excisionase family DNA binding protein